MNKQYFGISIGPVVSTLSMVRTPRALWNASYLFSFLMKHLYETIEMLSSDSNNCYQIISPAKVDYSSANGAGGKDIIDKKVNVGLYPDRIYVKITTNSLCDNKNTDNCIFEMISKIRESALGNLLANLIVNKDALKNIINGNYFNIMGAWCEAEKDSLAIAELNQQLDIMELMNVADSNDMAEKVYGLISVEKDSPLYNIHNNETDNRFKIKDLESIAKTTLNFKSNGKSKEKSYHRYYCVVQADGDNMGGVVSHKELKDGDNMTISNALLMFGKKAANMIKEFGGEPIYAGGDDLLFLAPVIGWKKNENEEKRTEHIISFIERLDKIAFKNVIESVEKIQKSLPEGVTLPTPSLSFGISVNYVKYPLYEALESARNLLFNEAKNIANKKAIALTLRKHSGESFKIAFSRKEDTSKKEFLIRCLNNLIMQSSKDSVVSAIAYKLRTFSYLVNYVMKEGGAKLDATFENLIKSNDAPEYSNAVKKLISTAFPIHLAKLENDDKYKSCKTEEEKNEYREHSFINSIYSYMRIAKFLNGEEVKEKKRKEKKRKKA